MQTTVNNQINENKAKKGNINRIWIRRKKIIKKERKYKMKNINTTDEKECEKVILMKISN